MQTAKGLGDNGIWRIAKLNGIFYLLDVGSKTTSFSGLFRVLTRFVQKYTVRVAHLELVGVNLDFAVEDDVLPSAKPTHEGDLVGETQSIVAAPPQGDLASVGFEKTGIANQTGARDVGVGDRHSSVRNKRSLL